MKQIMKIIPLILVLCLFASCQQNKTSNLALLDNQIPTDSARVFGEGVISTNNFEFSITFSPEMDELFFTRRKPEANNEIYTAQFRDGQWSEPQLAFFTSETGWDFEPHISPDGNRLYFGSIRPLPDSTESTGLHQWYSEKAESGWSTPEPLENPFMERSVTMFLTSAANGNLYFTTGEKGERPEDWGIYQAIQTENGYNGIIRMGDEINSRGEWIAHSFIAPDESYMIYDFKSDSGFGKADLYISFNNEGNWSEPINLGPKVNTGKTEMCASVSPDGKYLFFHRGDEDSGDIYWIDFRPIKTQLLEETLN